jgi:hypothetical protein
VDSSSRVPESVYLLAVFERTTQRCVAHGRCSTGSQYARITIQKHVQPDEAMLAHAARREGIYHFLLSMYNAGTLDLSSDIELSADNLHDALSEFETLMENIEQSRHTFTPRKTLEIEVLNLQAQFLSRLSEFFLNIYARFEDLDGLFCNSGIGLCFCDVLRTLRLQQWRSQAMELRALEEITLRRSA